MQKKSENSTFFESNYLYDMVIEDIQIQPDVDFRKGDINNIPFLTIECLLKFFSKSQILDERPLADENLCVDYVQVSTEVNMCEVRALVFPKTESAQANINAFARVSTKLETTTGDICEATCDQCTEPSPCSHILTFLCWLNRKSLERSTVAVADFWGQEIEELKEQAPANAIRVRNLFQFDDLRLECDIESASLTDADETGFLDSVMDEMEAVGLREATFSRYDRPITEEFEPIFVHHTLLDMPNNFVRNVNSFMLHMEDQSKQGLFDRFAKVSHQHYKSQLWLEAQYMRLRCSIIHRIASRRDSSEDEDILNALFMKNRNRNIEGRQQLKQHKRFILKQTEKLENKTYHECGILISESYPYICATPDGITDDHIVEIKAPHSEAEFEQYLECCETISPKYMAQIQIQMYVANVTKALYCVLSPTFDTTGALHYVWVQADMEFVASLLGAAEDFWKDVVFPHLSNIYFESR